MEICVIAGWLILHYGQFLKAKKEGQWIDWHLVRLFVQVERIPTVGCWDIGENIGSPLRIGGEKMRYLPEFYVLRSDPPFAGPGRYTPKVGLSWLRQQKSKMWKKGAFPKVWTSHFYCPLVSFDHRCHPGPYSSAAPPSCDLTVFPLLAAIRTQL